MWQIASGAVVFGICFLIVRGPPVFETLQWQTWAGVFYSGCFGTAFAYFIWYNIIGKVSTATASLGTLANPVVGVIGSVILLGERPTSADWIGFALIFAAAACVLLQPRPQPAERPRIGLAREPNRTGNRRRSPAHGCCWSLLSLLWGTNWPVIKIGLETMSPWSSGSAASPQRAVPDRAGQAPGNVDAGAARAHPVDHRGFEPLNIVVVRAVQRLRADHRRHRRVAVVTYSFPVWASLLGWLMLGERLTPQRR